MQVTHLIETLLCMGLHGDALDCNIAQEGDFCIFGV